MGLPWSAMGGPGYDLGGRLTAFPRASQSALATGMNTSFTSLKAKNTITES